VRYGPIAWTLRQCQATELAKSRLLCSVLIRATSSLLPMMPHHVACHTSRCGKMKQHELATVIYRAALLSKLVRL
jgi:hypothetical protein